MLKLVLVLAVVHSVLALGESESFIVGGSDALRGQFPHVASFRYFPLGLHGCSGSIVSRDWILTAAQCVHRRAPFEIVVGANELSDFGTRFLPDKIVIHPNYRAILNPLRNNDIALVKTDFLIEFNELIQAVSIGQDFVTRSRNGIVAGFGAREMFPGDPPSMSETLQYIRLNVIRNFHCNARIALLGNDFPRIARNTQVCTYNDAQQGICYGDSGSGLLVNNELVGVASRKILPCARGMPDIFIRVSEYKDWIDSYISP